MRIQEMSSNILSQMHRINKWRHDFLCHLFHLIFATRGRMNIKNLSRYSPYNETTFHRHFEKTFDFTEFNSISIKQIDRGNRNWIAAVDCSFIAKSGKKTYGLDKFWSNASSCEKIGLEVSALSLIDVVTKEAYMLDIQQTPNDLRRKQESEPSQKVSYSRIDFYIKQISNLRSQLIDHKVRYVVADGHYTTCKMFEAFDNLKELDLIGKLRRDSNLRYLYDEQERGPALTRRRYDGKVKYDNSTNGWRRWQKEGYSKKGFAIYSRVLNSLRFKRNLKVVACVDEQSGEYFLLFSTALELSGAIIAQYYACRFQIEFLFRDAKQFTGLEHGQTRKKEKLHFHFNLSMCAVNLARMDIKQDQRVQSLNDYQRLVYNEKIIKLFMSNSGLNPELDIYQLAQRKSVYFGLMRA